MTLGRTQVRGANKLPAPNTRMLIVAAPTAYTFKKTCWQTDVETLFTRKLPNCSTELEIPHRLLLDVGMFNQL